MEKVIEQLDSIISRVPTPVTPAEDFNMQNNSLDCGPSNSTADGILELCRDQARKIRELNEENYQLRDTVRQLKSALNFAHELTVSVSAEKKAARGSVMEIERQLEIALMEKRALEDGLQKANVYITEVKRKMLVEERKNEQTQTKLNELKERCDALQQDYERSNNYVTFNRDGKYSRQPPSRIPTAYPSGCMNKEQIDELQVDHNRKLADKNKEINELVDKARRQTEIILRQGADITSLQEKIDQLENNGPRPFQRTVETNPVKSFFRRSFTVHRRKLQVRNEEQKDPFV